MFEWLNIQKLSPHTYGEKILQSIIASKYAKEKLTVLLMMLMTAIIRLHLITLISMLTSITFWVDCVVQIPITVVITLNSNVIYNVVEYYQPQIYKITRHVINNYTFENYRRWKRNVVLSSCIYLLILLLFIEITNVLMFIYVIQYIISYVFVDLIEQKHFEEMVENIYNKPKNVIYGEVNIKKDYCVTRLEEKKEPESMEKKDLCFMIINNFRES